MKVLIVGAGIIGAACAHSLASRGVQVEILDLGDAPSGTSARCDGMLMLSNKEPADALKALQAIEDWKRVVPVIGDVQFEKLRTILVALDDATQVQLVARAAALRSAGVSLREMTGNECRTEDPGLSAEVQYGFVADESSDVQPMIATVRFLESAKAAGAVLHSGVHVHAVEQGAVDTDRGRFVADEVLVTTGPWTGDLMKNTGFAVPIEPRRGHVLVAERRASSIAQCGALDGGYMAAVQSKDAGLHVVPNVELTQAGTVLLGTSRERVGFDEKFNIDVMREICRKVVRMYPALSDCRIIRGWVGFRPWTPDKQPMVGQLAPGLSIAAGHEGEGIVYAPFTGETIARMLVDGTAPPIEWDPARFASAATN